MITLPRAAIARFGAVARKAVPRAVPSPPIIIRAGSRCRGLELVTEDLAIRLTIPGRGPAESMAITTHSLESMAGDAGEVALALDGGDQVAASWEIAGTPQHRNFEALPIDKLRLFPKVAADLAPVDDSLLAAMAAAVPLAARDSTRYAMNNLLLEGKSGRIVVTDSKMLLMQSRWEFPWTDNVLIPAMPVWTCRELRDTPIAIGRHDGLAFVTSGPWTIAVAIDKSGRFPSYVDVLPNPSRYQTYVDFTDADCALLQKELPRLPINDDFSHPVNLVTGPIVEMQSAGARLILPTATAAGTPVRLNLDRRHLLKALKLGFRRLDIVNSTVPAVFTEDLRLYMFMPLTPEHRAVAPTQPESPTTAYEDSPMATRNATAEPSTNGALNGSANGHAVDPLSDAEAIRGLLRDADTRLARLVAHLKHHRKQSRALRTAVDSLRNLPELAH